MFVDWSGSFSLNGPLREYSLTESNLRIYSGFHSSLHIPRTSDKSTFVVTQLFHNLCSSCSQVHIPFSFFPAIIYNSKTDLCDARVSYSVVILCHSRNCNSFPSFDLIAGLFAFLLWNSLILFHCSSIITFTLFFRSSAFVFQVTCTTDSGSASSPVIKYNTATGTGMCPRAWQVKVTLHYDNGKNGFCLHSVWAKPIQCQ